MAFSISAVRSASSSFTLVETNGNESLSLTDSANSSSAYLYGVSGNEVSNAASITGLLPSGGTTVIDLYGVNQTTFKTEQTIQFTGVKYISISNTSTTEGYDFTIAATGSNACTNLFNGGSGNLLVKPGSNFHYNDPFTGVIVSASNRYLALDDSGSGVNYKILILGLD